MPISWNEIRDNAIRFSREWADASSEDADAKSFWDGFFAVFGVNRRRIASFEYRVRKQDKSDGYIDVLWKGNILVEHKSLGANLDKARSQALSYFPGLKDKELPKYLLLCDFKRFNLTNLETNETVEFTLDKLPHEIGRFAFIAGYEVVEAQQELPVNIEAAELMGSLHDQLKDAGYGGHDLEVLLVRLLFCLFADDTEIFVPRNSFQAFVKNRTADDGSDLGARLTELFEILNQEERIRQKNIDATLKTFPYVNGKLFAERLRMPAFSSAMRAQLLRCCELDWSQISPDIFGALFQSIMNRVARRNIGAHYTSRENILKVIRPLFLDSLWEEFEEKKNSTPGLWEFHRKLRNLKFLDPACGCGNFLVVSYHELRLLEMEILRAMNLSTQLDLIIRDLIWLDVDQFYGIEIEEFPAQIAQVALWLVDHQMNSKVALEFGQPFLRIPLRTSARIEHKNALRIEWENIVEKAQLSYILGNPPFIGSKFLNQEQKEDMEFVCGRVEGFGVLDYVTAWYVKAAAFIQNSEIKCAFVSTNSISQGEQVGILWKFLYKQGISIFFAHRTFRWSNEAKGMAAVHCVIIGFASFKIKAQTIYDYPNISGESHAIKAENINAYLVDGPNVLVLRRDTPLCNVPTIGIGNKPIDGGRYLFTEEERDDFVRKEPLSEKWFRRWIGSDEFINRYERWCLLLKDCPPQELRKMPEVLRRIEEVKSIRLASTSKQTQKLAETPTKFHVENIPTSTYLVIPEVSSERRHYIPIGFMDPETLSSNLVKIVPNATLYHFGVLSSHMHMSWVRAVGGRLESRYRYSKDIIYNNYPWPVGISDKLKKKIEDAAQEVLNIRSKYPQSSFADLYDPLTMPPDLLRAHRNLDNYVDLAYTKRKFHGEAERVAFLFDLYDKLSSPLMAGEKKTNPERKTARSRSKDESLSTK